MPLLVVFRVQAFWEQFKGTSLDVVKANIRQLEEFILRFANPRKEAAFLERAVALEEGGPLFVVESETHRSQEGNQWTYSDQCSHVCARLLDPCSVLRSPYLMTKVDRDSRVWRLSVTGSGPFTLARHQVEPLGMKEEITEKKVTSFTRTRIKYLLKWPGMDPSSEISNWRSTLEPWIVQWRTLFHVTDTLWDFASLHFQSPEFASLLDLLDDQMVRIWDAWFQDAILDSTLKKSYQQCLRMRSAFHA